jgi:hypothetical protein
LNSVQKKLQAQLKEIEEKIADRNKALEKAKKQYQTALDEETAVNQK